MVPSPSVARSIGGGMKAMAGSNPYGINDTLQDDEEVEEIDEAEKEEDEN